MFISTIAIALSALAFVITLLAIAHRFAVRFKLPQILSGNSGSVSTLAIEQSLSLDPRRRLLLISCEGRQVLLLIGGPQDLLLGWLECKA